MAPHNRRELIRVEEILAVHMPDAGFERRVVQEQQRRPVGRGRKRRIKPLQRRFIERAVRLAGAGPYTYAGHQVVPVDEAHRWVIDGAPAAAAASNGVVWTSVHGDVWELETTPRQREVEQTAGAEVAAPMPGLVIAAQAIADRHVRRGDLLFVVEAMKMELRVEAPADGRVTRVLASVGQQVERGQRLAEFEADPV